jgi:hypothetical protein
VKLVSVVIPARNEEWLRRTVDDVLANIRGDSEVIVVLDGCWADPPLDRHDRLTVIHQPQSIGQRAATNMAARVSTARYVMKLDAHCRVSEGFDLTLAADAELLGANVCQIPAQYNLHVFDWVCACGARQYQGPTPVTCACKNPRWARDIRWELRKHRLTTSWRFDADLHFQYWGAHQKEHRAEQIHDVMSCLGACWFVHRETFLALGALDEGHGSWGQMGTELACKYWLSGGRMVVNKNAWFAHLFRTQGGDFGFPYAISNTEQEAARQYSRSLWLNATWPLATRSLASLVRQFNPPDWSEEQINALSGRSSCSTVVESPAGGSISISVSRAEDDTRPTLYFAGSSPPTKGCIWYTDHRPSERILRASLESIQGGLPVVRVGTRHTSYVDRSVPRDPGYLTMFMQILEGLEALDTDIVFFCEHDVLYHPSHFRFQPVDNIYHYNLNVWKVDVQSGRAVTYRTKQTSGLVGYRELLIEHYRKRIELVNQHGFSRKMGFEPGSHGRKERVDDVPSEVFYSEFPNIDLRHNKNLTATRWSQKEFRDQRNCQGWCESTAHHIPGWLQLPELLKAMR